MSRYNSWQCNRAGPNRIAHNRNKETSTTHAVLARSNYNANKNPTQRHVKPEIMKKLPKVILT
ncbi:MAG: hypothetical protein RXN78_04625 [Vulcanisaeta sp.]